MFETILVMAALSGGQCPAPCGSVVYNHVRVQEPNVVLRLKNIPGGYERTREWVRINFDGRVRTVPVINGVLPSVGFDGTNVLHLDYSAKVFYDVDFHKGIIVYELNGKKPTEASVRKAPTAVKPFEEIAPQKATVPSVKNVVPKTQTPKRPSDDDLDSLLKTPSSVR